MTLSVAIMAHRDREAMVDDLLSRLDRDVPVVWDTINDRHDTGARAMGAFDPQATHHLVLQDDVLPCRDLIAGVERAMESVPKGCPASFYTGAVRPFKTEVDRAVNRARQRSISWVSMQGIYWGPAVVLPTADIPTMLRWYQTAGSKVTNYDRRMSAWYSLRQTDVWYSRPSLVDHRGVLSLAGHPGGNRHAHGFIGEDASALDITWGTRATTIPRTAAMDDARQQAAQIAKQR